MTIYLDTSLYNSITSDELSYLVIKQAIDMTIAKDISIKSNVYNQLNEFQKALFSFHVFHQHAKKSIDEFVFFTEEFLKNGFWDKILLGINKYGNDSFEVLMKNIKNNEINIHCTYEEYLELSKKHILLLNQDIRNYPDRYICLM